MSISLIFKKSFTIALLLATLGVAKKVKVELYYESLCKSSHFGAVLDFVHFGCALVRDNFILLKFVFLFLFLFEVVTGQVARTTLAF